MPMCCKQTYEYLFTFDANASGQTSYKSHLTFLGSLATFTLIDFYTPADENSSLFSITRMDEQRQR